MTYNGLYYTTTLPDCITRSRTSTAALVIIKNTTSPQPVDWILKWQQQLGEIITLVTALTFYHITSQHRRV